MTEDLIGQFPQISGVCLFGSVARGDAGPDSDVDLFVVGSDPELTPSAIRRQLRLWGEKPRVSIVYHTPTTLDRYVKTGSRFLLHLQLEGDVLYDPTGLLTALQSRSPIKAPIKPEVDGQLERLGLYNDLSRYNENFLFPLSHIFAIGKAIVMAILSENHIFEFNRDRAFDAFSAAFPDHSRDIEALRRLAPFYGYVSKGVERDLPFSYHGCKMEVRNAVESIRRIATRART